MKFTEGYRELEQIAKGLGIKINSRNFRILLELWKLRNKLINLSK